MKLSALKKKGKTLFTTAQAMKFGVSPQMLRYYLKKGELVRLSHGVYTFAESQGFDLESIIREKLISIPQGVIGLKTALRLYDLTEELPRDIEIIVPENNVPKRRLEDVHLYIVSRELARTAVTKVRGIPTTTLERTLIDLLKFGEPLSTVLRAIEEARKKRKQVSLTELKKLSVKLRAKAKVGRLLEALI